jgi:antitoxin VapB
MQVFLHIQKIARIEDNKRSIQVDCVYTAVYTIGMEKTEKAKLFQNGGSQAVRLPKSCRFPEDQREVVVKKVGRRIILEPVDEWQPEFVASLGTWEGSIERPAPEPILDVRDPFA